MPERAGSKWSGMWLIARREYLERIRTRAFLIATLVIPMILGAVGFGGTFLASRTRSATHVLVLGGDAAFNTDLKREIDAKKEAQLSLSFAADTPAERARLAAERRDRSSGLAGVLTVTPAAVPGRSAPQVHFDPVSTTDEATAATLSTAITHVVTRAGLTRGGMSQADADALLTPVKLLDTSAANAAATALKADYALFFLMYFVIMQFGMNTARSIIEEKGSRIVEVLLATVEPEQMMAGKILGVGAVGLTQVFVWMAVATAYGAYAVTVAGGHVLLTPVQIFFFIAYFLFGFLIYTSIAAALGAMTNSEQELQQLNLFLVLPLSFCLLCLVSIVRSPDSVFSRVVSLIPLCSPLLMNFRISIGHPAGWEIALSFVLMGLTVYGILWLTSRIYRVGILMYGKKPNLPEIMRWIQYS